MKWLLPVWLLVNLGMALGASNRTEALLDLTRKTLEFFPSLRGIARSEDGQRGTLVETTVKRINDVFANFKPRERLNLLKSGEGGEGLMKRLAGSLDPILNPLRNLTAHVASNRTLSALIPKRGR